MTIRRIGYAIWFALTIYLFQIAVPRPLDWTIIGPIGGGILLYFVDSAWQRRAARDKRDRP
ncbi:MULTISPECIES: hypothetical protein [unclassified Microbacterium]|uniref:hypothetical protein n=1 Tax=unclassified Microbacterium TaxID=2609290 RepID=UPI00342B06B0